MIIHPDEMDEQAYRQKNGWRNNMEAGLQGFA